MVLFTRLFKMHSLHGTTTHLQMSKWKISLCSTLLPTAHNTHTHTLTHTHPCKQMQCSLALKLPGSNMGQWLLGYLRGGVHSLVGAARAISPPGASSMALGTLPACESPHSRCPGQVLSLLLSKGSDSVGGRGLLTLASDHPAGKQPQVGFCRLCQ